MTWPCMSPAVTECPLSRLSQTGRLGLQIWFSMNSVSRHVIVGTSLSLHLASLATVEKDILEKGHTDKNLFFFLKKDILENVIVHVGVFPIKSEAEILSLHHSWLKHTLFKLFRLKH